MPHIWIEYSGNLALDTRTLMRTVQDAAIGDGSLFPLAGARTRALRVDDYLIVDGHPDNAFVHVTLRIGHGRSDEQKAALGARVFEALTAALAPQMASRPLGLSMQIEEAHPVLNYKLNNYREHLAARAAAAPSPRTVVGVALNTPEALAALGAGVAIEVWHQCGEKLHGEAQQAYRAAGVEGRVDAFITDMAAAYAWADLVVCRSGASTLAELCAVGIGSVLVPFAAAVDDHQTRNADYLVERGAAELLKQDDALAANLEGVLRALAHTPARRMQMAQAARALAKVDAAERIADIILEEAA